MKAVFIGRLKWDVSVLLLGVSQLLVSQSLQILANDQTSVARFNDAIDEASGSSSEGIGKPKEVSLGVKRLVQRDLLLLVLSLALLEVGVTTVKNLSSTRGSHDCNLGSGPAVVCVAAEML